MEEKWLGHVLGKRLDSPSMKPSFSFAVNLKEIWTASGPKDNIKGNESRFIEREGESI